MTPASTAIRALFRTLRDGLPARLLALDASRRAVVECRAGPYVFTTPATLVLGGETVEILDGTYTAAALADVIGTRTAFVASTDGDRLVLTGTAAPTDDEPAVLAIGDGTANDVLGLRHGDDAVCLAIGTPAPAFYERRALASDEVTGPTVVLESLRVLPTRPNAEVATVAPQLTIGLPGYPGADLANIEATEALAEALTSTIEAGDGRGPFCIGNDPNVLVCRVGALTIFTSTGESKQTQVPIGIARLDLEIEVFTPRS